jgi:excisionase family DNA binding protein
MSSTTAPAEETRRTTISEIRDLATLPVWSDTGPSAAGVLGVERTHAYVLAKRGEIPTIRLGRRVVVPTAKLLALLGVEA